MKRLAASLIILGITSAALAVEPVEHEGQAAEPRLERVTIIRPSAETEVKASVQKLSWADQTETYVFENAAAVPERAVPLKSTRIKVNGDGTYTATRARTPDAMRGRGITVQSIGNCDPEIDWDCGGDTGGGGGTAAVGKSITAVDRLTANSVVLRTQASLGVTVCKNNAYAAIRVDHADSTCIAAPGWVATGCSRNPPAVGVLTTSATNTVAAQYVSSDGVSIVRGVRVSSDAMGNMIASTDEIVATTYPSSACDSTNGGGSPPGDPDNANKGETYCAPVYDGASGQYLGHCCGNTSLAIIRCAAEFL